MSRLRSMAFAAAAAVGVAIAPLALATSASAAEPPAVLFFSLAGTTDVAEEDATMIAAIEAGGSVVTVFDGGDASAAAWEAALTGFSVLVIPEHGAYYVGGTPGISDEAMASITAWTAAGGRVFAGGGYDFSDTLSALSGLDYSSVWNTSNDGQPWTLQIEAPLVAELYEANGTGGLETAGWDPTLTAALTPIYSTGSVVGIGQFAIGAGSFTYLGYDWFPDEDDITNGVRQPWDAALVWLLNPVQPAGPELAATGVDSTTIWVGSASLLMLGAAMLLIARTRRIEA